MNNQEKTIEVIIPFSGFYDSIHSMTIDDAIERELEEEDSTFDVNSINYQALFLEYAKDYCLNFGAVFCGEGMTEKEIEFKFAEFHSPREYNFETDRITAKISKDDLKEIMRNAPLFELGLYIKEHCTSRDGFISYYSSNINDWFKVPYLEWSSAQLGLVLDFMLDHDNIHLTDFEMDVIDQGNLSETIYSHI